LNSNRQKRKHFTWEEGVLYISSLDLLSLGKSRSRKDDPGFLHEKFSCARMDDGDGNCAEKTDRRS
jgi:hypothetical protein